MTTYYVDCVTPRTTAAVWTADTVKALGNRVWSTSLTAASAKYIYEATDIGSSPNKTHATTEPTWPTTVGNTVVDADITWTCRAPDSWDEALPGLQGAADLAVAGDIVYCRGTQSATAAIDFDTNSGTNAGGFIKFIGCNSSGTVDGTRFIVDQQSGSRKGIVVGAMALIWFENIEVKRCASNSGFSITTYQALGMVLINCCANNTGNNGFDLTGLYNAVFIRCVSYSNTQNGFYRPAATTRVLFCCSRDNSSSGFECNNAGTSYIGCVSHGNTDDGSVLANNVFFMNCAIDGNTDDGISVAAHTALLPAIVIGSRITNHSGSGDIGLNANSEIVVTGFNYFENNADANIQNDTLHYFIPLEGGSSTSNLEDLSNTTSGGYVDPTNHDFSTNYVDAGDPDLRRTAITIPWS